MISERSRDTGSNDAENSALITEKKHKKIYSNVKQLFLSCNNISQYYYFFYNFWSNKCSHGEQKKEIFQKCLNILPTPNF